MAKPTANLAGMSDSSDDDGLQESMWHIWQCVGLGRVVLNPDHLQRLQPQLHQVQSIDRCLGTSVSQWGPRRVTLFSLLDSLRA